MASEGKPPSRNPILVVLLIPPAAGIVAAAISGRAAWAALPLGFLFGVFLKKGDLCGAAGCSEVLLFRSFEKLRGIGVCIAVSMAGFAVLEGFGWITLNPKPLDWMHLVVGGLLFGTGSVLAGGCVTGTLYKAGAGHLNSMAALLGMPIGVGAVRHGFLNPLHRWMGRFVVEGPDGGPVTLPSLTGMPYAAWAAFFAAGTLGLGGWMLLRQRGRGPRPAEGSGRKRRSFLAGPWKPWQSGIAVGLLAVPVYLCSAASGLDYPLGTTGGVYAGVLVLTDREAVPLWTPREETIVPEEGARDGRGGEEKAFYLWLLLFDASLVAGSWYATRAAGRFRILPKPPEQVLLAFPGGFLLGAGAALAGGCFYGHVVSGWALMSMGSVLFGFSMLLSNWSATWFYLMGRGRP